MAQEEKLELLQELLKKTENSRFEIRGNGKTLILRGSSFEIRWEGTRIQ